MIRRSLTSLTSSISNQRSCTFLVDGRRSLMHRSSKPSIMTHYSLVTMYGGRRERRYAYRNIFGAFGSRVLDPFSLVRDHGLSSPHVDCSVLMLHANKPFQNYSK